MRPLSYRLGLLAIDRRAASAVEFALVAPIVFMLLFGGFQIGMVMLGYNSVRALAGEVGRYTVVQYMTGNKLSDEQIETTTIARGVSEGSGLSSTNLQVNATTATTSSVPGVKQINLTISYAVPNILPFYSGESFEMKVQKPIFVYDDDISESLAIG